MSFPEIKDEKTAKVLTDIRRLMTVPEGRSFFRYLIEASGVAETPVIFPDEKMTYKYMGFLEFGNSVFKLLAQADPEVSAVLFTQIIKEKNEELFNDAKIPG